MEPFEPEIIAFCCEYCSYAAADLAGSMRLSYPTNVKIVKIPCTGRFDVIHALKVFEAGADGVFAGVEDRIRQYHIASYLEITPVALSRIRRKLRENGPS